MFTYICDLHMSQHDQAIDTQVHLEVRHKSTDYTALGTCKYVSILLLTL